MKLWKIITGVSLLAVSATAFSFVFANPRSTVTKANGAANPTSTKVVMPFIIDSAWQTTLNGYQGGTPHQLWFRAAPWKVNNYGQQIDPFVNSQGKPAENDPAGMYLVQCPTASLISDPAFGSGSSASRIALFTFDRSQLLNGMAYQLVTVDSNTGSVGLYTSKNVPPSTYAAGENLKLFKIDTASGSRLIEQGSAVGTTLANATVGHILSGFYTCSSSAENGYGAYATLNSLYALSGRTYANADTINDFSYNDGEYDYMDPNAPKETVLLQDKVLEMASRAATRFAPLSGQGLANRPDTSSEGIAVIALGAGALLAIAAFWYMRRRHQR